MATDDHDTDDQNEERAGPESGRSPETPGTYANAGRETEPRTDQQVWDARGEAPGQADAPRDRQPERRYGTNQPSRRYGSKQPTGSQNEPIQGQRKQPDIRSKPEGVPREDLESGRSDDPPQGGSPRQTEDPQAEEPRRGDQTLPESASTEPAPSESTPPKRTQPLQEPTKPDREQTELAVSDRGPADESEPGAPSESTEQSDVPKYGGPRDSGLEQNRGQSVERQRTQREYERRFDKQRARQRDFQRDKSGGKYRRR